MDSIKNVAVKQSVYNIVTGRIIALLEQGVIPWKKPWIETGVPQNLISRRPYRGVNVLLLGGLGYERNLYLTFDQVRKAGGMVRRGEQGNIIVFYTVKKEKKLSEIDEQQTKPKWLLRYYKVFNISQCELPGSIVIPPAERKNDPIASCERIVTECPQPLVIVHKKPEAYYSSLDYINMPAQNTFVNSESYYDALFHEMTHWTGHRTRLNRPGIAEGHRTEETYSFEELVAQLGASFLSNHAGILPPVIQNSASYIAGWLEVLRNDTRMILKASAVAQRAADFILNRRTEEITRTIEHAEFIGDEES